jgi:hypothetical protein
LIREFECGIFSHLLSSVKIEVDDDDDDDDEVVDGDIFSSFSFVSMKYSFQLI